LGVAFLERRHATLQPHELALKVMILRLVDKDYDHQNSLEVPRAILD
jgi:hypothetical protein